MTLSDLYQYIDHTNLSPTATVDDINQLHQEALQCGCPAICIPPAYVAHAHWLNIQATSKHQLIADVPLSDNVLSRLPAICTVIGFPLGYDTTETKVSAAKSAIADGATEIDVVINLGAVKSGNWTAIQDELDLLRKITADHILKVIIETCYLDTAEIIELCRIVSEIGADYIKTSTGFGTAGAQLEHILLFKEHCAPEVKIKAAGGIRTVEDIQAFVQAGCDRIGSSSGLLAIRKAIQTTASLGGCL